MERIFTPSENKIGWSFAICPELDVTQRLHCCPLSIIAYTGMSVMKFFKEEFDVVRPKREVSAYKGS
jgi:hypothetical protein